jgi:hypothetical protein
VCGWWLVVVVVVVLVVVVVCVWGVGGGWARGVAAVTRRVRSDAEPSPGGPTPLAQDRKYMLCYANAMLCYAMLCYAMLCAGAQVLRARPAHVHPLRLRPVRHAGPLIHAVLCYAMLCDAMRCDAMLCDAMLFSTRPAQPTHEPSRRSLLLPSLRARRPQFPPPRAPIE